MSDSDYVVEDFVQPETVRHTYTKEEDVISGSDDEKSGESEDEDVSSKNAQPESDNVHEEEIEEPEEEPPRPNNRFILYVTNLSGETTRSMIQDYFGDCGEIKSIRIPKVRLGCYAFVEMKDFSGFKNGLKMNNKELDGKKIQVYEGSKNKKHTSAKTKNLKRKNQQKHLDNFKIKRNKNE